MFSWLHPVGVGQAGEFITKCTNYAILLSLFYKHVIEIQYIGNPVKPVPATFQPPTAWSHEPENSGPEINIKVGRPRGAGQALQPCPARPCGFSRTAVPG